MEDAGTQVIVNMANGQGFKEAVKNVDYKQAVKTGAIGAVTSLVGVPTGKTLGKTIVTASKAVGTNVFAATINEGVQVGSSLLQGQSLQEAVANIDVSGVRNAYVSSAVTGAVDKYVSSAVEKVLDNPQICKTSAAVQNATSNVIGTVAGTSYANSSEEKPLTEGMCRDVIISFISGGVTGFLKQNGSLVNTSGDLFSNPNNAKVMYITTIKNGKEAFDSITIQTPKEGWKSFFVSLGQEMVSASTNQGGKEK